MLIAHRNFVPFNRSGAAALLSGLLFLAACASMPPPTSQVADARAAVARAAAAGGSEIAPAELKLAEGKLNSAEQAMVAEDYPRAMRLAEQAQVDAALAEARVLATKAQKASTESQDANRALREEMGRKTQ